MAAKKSSGKGRTSLYGTAGAGKGKGKVPTPAGRIKSTPATRAASNRKD